MKVERCNYLVATKSKKENGQNLTQKLANEIREHINRKIGSSVLPMIIEIPDKEGSSEGTSDQMADLIKRVIGVEMVK